MKNRVRIPIRNSKALLDLAKKVREKHLADGEASPLKLLNWEQISPKLEVAEAAHEKANRMKREMVEAYQQRNLQLEEIIGALRDSRDVLSGVYKKEMKVLGQWGYEVLDVRTNGTQPTAVESGVKV